MTDRSEIRRFHNQTKGTITRLHAKYYGHAKRVIANENGAIRTGMKRRSPGLSRNDLMLKAKERGIKNFRVLNKEELQMCLTPTTQKEDVDKIVAGAVARWKAGWGKKTKEPK